jgi:hypothetical protein
MDNSWDNSGQSRPSRKWKYGNSLFTASVVAVSILGVCSIGVLWFSRNQANILEVERERAKPDWAAAAVIVESLQSEGGSKALFQANPKLGRRFHNESDFLVFAAQYRSRLDPLPKEVPHPGEKNFGHSHGFGLGPTILSYKMPHGLWATFHWSAPFNNPSRQLTDLEFYQ